MVPGGTPRHASGAVFRPSCLAATRLAPTAPAASTGEAPDILPTAAITSHPALAASQIRWMKRRTMERTSRLKRKRTHGFLSRIRTRNGRKTLQRRKSKGRYFLSN